MSFILKTWWLIVTQTYQSMLAHRQPPAPNHIGPYGGSFLDLYQNDKR